MRVYLFQSVFYISALLTILGAVAVVLQKNPVKAVLALVFSFFMVSIIWMMSNAEFLALVLVLVYVGAVMTLFLFVVMMLNVDTETLKKVSLRYIALAFILLFFFLLVLWKVMPKDLLGSAVEHGVSLQISNTESLGMVLYTNYLPLVEITALLLLVAIVASITLVHRGGRDMKRQSIRKQLMVKKSERLKIIKLANK